MNKKILTIGMLVTVFSLMTGLILITVENNKSNSSSPSKSAYQLYCESHPDYHKTESEWLDDLVNGRLGDKDKWTVTFDSGGGSLVDSQIVLDGEKAIKPANPTRLGYTFQEWLYNGQPWVFFGYSVTSNMTLIAKWSINTYSINYDYNGGSISFVNPSSYNITSEFEIEEPIKEGYTFDCWVDEYDREIESIVPGMTGDLVLTAKWSANKNTLEVVSDDYSKGHVSIVEGEGYTDENVKVVATSTSPYMFKGWFDENDVVVSYENPYTFDMPAADCHLVAKFDETRELSLSVSDSEKGTVSGSGKYVIDGAVTVSCSIEEGNLLKGWFDGDNNLVSTKNPYKFNMPDMNYSLTAVFMTDEEIEQYKYDKAHGVIPSISEDGKTLTYGVYPQSVLDDAEKVAQLDAITDSDEYGYVMLDGDYYIKKNVSVFDFARYYDVTGLTIPKSFDNGEEMINGDIRWFKVEPIEWEILSENNGSYKLLSNRLLEKSKYHTSGNPRIIDDVKIYANNYKYSYVHEWLNNDFLDKLFHLNDSYIVDMEVDNSVNSTGSSTNVYACENTIDKIYLPSVLEMNEYHKTHDSMTCLTTDYLRSSNTYYDYITAEYCSDYWTRSPDSDATYIDHCKRVAANGWIGRSGAALDMCIRPCINIEIK